MNQINRVIEDQREDINRLCEQYRVQRLEVFGSAADEAFDPKRSDLDFLVEFLPLRKPPDGSASTNASSVSHVLVHGCDSLNHDIVWHVIKKRLPQLRQEVRAVLGQREDSQ